jgi:hypothetical protein
MKKSVLLLTAIFALAFASCDDESTNPPQDCTLENSLKLQTGNYWIYNFTEIDSNGNATGRQGIDSTIVERTETIAGKQAYLVVSRSSVGNSEFTVDQSAYYAVENGKLYTLLGNISRLGGFGNPTSDAWIPPIWVKIADCSRTEWSMIDTTIVGDTIKMSGEDTLIGDQLTQWRYKVDGLLKERQAITVGNQSLSASVFKTSGAFTHSLLLPLNATFATNGLRDMPFEINNELWFAEGIGMVRFEAKAFDNYDYPARGKNVPGIRKTLVRYSVK